MSEREGEGDDDVNDEEPGEEPRRGAEKEREQEREKKEGAAKKEESPPKSAEKSEEASESESFVAKKQRLFLVEFLIDTVTIDPTEFCEEVMEGQTCVTLRFLDFPPMNICEKDFDPNKEYGVDKVRFNAGKSLMFAFAEKQCESPPPIMAELTVSKACPEGSHAEKVDLGRIRICMADLFTQVYDVAKFAPDKLPFSKSIKDCFMLIGRGKRTTGEVGVYVRLTCLGQNVVTEFQCGSNMKQDPVLFKNREGKKIYQFTGTDKEGQDGEAESTYRQGCGCMAPAPPQKYPGGQGDAGQMSRCKRTPPASGKGGRPGYGAPEKGYPGQGGFKSSDKYRPQFPESELAKAGLAVDRVDTHADQNCFVLRVGDKGQIPDRGKIILEFRTPKQKILPKVLPPYHEDIAIQTDTPKKAKGKKKKK
ncbi:UNVERIFIED_CONTAM: hypothetical protein PYX00_001536 [Menopon gallinae]|uniref:Uncharacterized protein n=1 Tax=Menopon gallinae TaxID=328185 RepID=A0AAW2IE60_9NEOP